LVESQRGHEWSSQRTSSESELHARRELASWRACELEHVARERSRHESSARELRVERAGRQRLTGRSVRQQRATSRPYESCTRAARDRVCTRARDGRPRGPFDTSSRVTLRYARSRPREHFETFPVCEQRTDASRRVSIRYAGRREHCIGRASSDHSVREQWRAHSVRGQRRDQSVREQRRDYQQPERARARSVGTSSRAINWP